MAVNNKQIRTLKPYLLGEEPGRTNVDGTLEWDMICPLHEDGVRSASLNVSKGEWWCFAGCGGGSVVDLLKHKSDWVPPSPGAASMNGAHSRNGSEPVEIINEGKIAGWHSALMSGGVVLDELVNSRGLLHETLERFEIGYDLSMKVYTIPIRDDEGQIINVRRYNMYPATPKSPKIFNVKGMVSSALYPIQILNQELDYAFICGGEWDSMVNNQNGFPTVTRTAAEDVWYSEWGVYFQGIDTVYLCHDKDDKGMTANRKVGRMLEKIVPNIFTIDLPYEYQKKHGKDLTDFWLDFDVPDMQQLMEEAEPYGKKVQVQGADLPIVTVLDSFDSQRAGEPVKLVVTVKGRKEPGYLVPRTMRLACTQDAGVKCNSCPLKAQNGDALVEIKSDDPVIMAMMDASDSSIKQTVAANYGVPGGKCIKLVQETEEHQSVEVLFARPSVDHADGINAGDYKTIKVTSVGRHNTMPNNTVGFTGALYANPRSQQNEFQAWNVERLDTSVDRFELDDKTIKMMKVFQPSPAQRPLKKLGEIARELAVNVTSIYGRPEMHALMDLTFHSVLSFNFAGQHINNGRLESLIVGDTRTGKSEAARLLIGHYGVGEVINCEAATFAGVIGGVQQLGGKDWAVTWGVVPMNDRRIVVLDEVSGLSLEEISGMSEVRSSGVAKLTKVEQDATLSRTRLLWLGNPRNNNMSMYTYGVDALKPLIGNMEDIARFDLAMALRIDDVASDEINRQHERTKLRYTQEACHSLVLWAWTRQPEHIKWARGAEDKVFKLAIEMGKRYIEDPPLVQAANVRIKIARVAAALAARTFSTKNGEDLIITSQHVEDAVVFMDRLYNMTTFGYAHRSAERIADRAEAEAQKDNIKEYLRTRPTLAKYLRTTGKFRRQDLEEVMNASKEEANSVINTLWEARMVYKDLGDIRVEPTLHALLREGKW